MKLDPKKHTAIYHVTESRLIIYFNDEVFQWHHVMTLQCAIKVYKDWHAESNAQNSDKEGNA